MSPAARRLTYQFGLYYFSEFVEMEDFNYNTLAEGALDGVARQEQAATARAAFAALTFQMLENLELGAGLRLSPRCEGLYSMAGIKHLLLPGQGYSVLSTRTPKTPSGAEI